MIHRAGRFHGTPPRTLEQETRFRKTTQASATSATSAHPLARLSRYPPVDHYREQGNKSPSSRDSLTLKFTWLANDKDHTQKKHNITPGKSMLSRPSCLQPRESGQRGSLAPNSLGARHPSPLCTPRGRGLQPQGRGCRISIALGHVRHYTKVVTPETCLNMLRWSWSQDRIRFKTPR